MSVPDWSAFDDLDPDRPGLVAAVIRGGTVEACASRGSEEPNGEPLRASSPFYVASIAKQLTAAAVGLLVLEGTVDLDDPVRMWIPELDPSWAPVRLRHLVDHTAGAPDANVADAAAGFSTGTSFTTADRIAVIATTRIEHQPGTVHRYSNHGYVLLAEVVGRATGTCLGAFASERFFLPLGMASTAFLDAASPRTVPGWAGGTRRVTIDFTCVGDGGLVTSIEDLARWDRWLTTSPLRPLMLTDRPVVGDGRLAHDAWGISVRSHHGRRIESHGGSIDGYLATFVRFPEPSVSVVVLANTDEHGIDGFGRRTQDFVGVLLAGHLDPALPPWTETHGEPIRC